jgi:excisionase family DNA binding protein
MSEEFLTPYEVMQRLSLTKSSLYRRVSDGTLPAPIKLGHLSRFKASEIEEALEALAQKRSNSFARGRAKC